MHPAGPETPSAAVQMGAAGTDPKYTDPMLLSKDAVGSVRSTLKLWLAAPAAATLPALSVKAGLPTTTATPSPLEVAVWVADAGPEVASAPVNVAVTMLVYQSLEPRVPLALV